MLPYHHPICPARNHPDRVCTMGCKTPPPKPQPAKKNRLFGRKTG